jgi:CheY-like chemotaxis protein
MKKVLIVDDDPDVCKFMKAKLEETKRFEVVIADDGWEAIRLAKSDKPDIVLCDIDMPDMDGVSVAEKLDAMSETKQIPLVFLSSLVTPKDAARGKPAGRWPMMSKQSPIPDIIRRIDDALAKPL